MATTVKTVGEIGRYPLAALILLALAWTSEAWAGPKIDPAEAHRRVQAGEITLIDVRAPREWRDTGTPEHALLITMHGKEGVQGFVADVSAAIDGDKSRPIALICAAGGRSSRLQSALEENGFTHVIDVREGVSGGLFSRGWKGRGLPLISYEH